MLLYTFFNKDANIWIVGSCSLKKNVSFKGSLMVLIQWTLKKPLKNPYGLLAVSIHHYSQTLHNEQSSIKPSLNLPNSYSFQNYSKFCSTFDHHRTGEEFEITSVIFL